MANAGNIQRLKRGELSHLGHKAAKHTDVHMGAPQLPQEQSTPPKSNGEIENLQDQVRMVKKLNEELSSELAASTLKVDKQLQNDNDELTANLSEMLAQTEDLVATNKELEEKLEEAQQQPEQEPVTGLRVVKINEVTETDDLMRLDCELKPTTGPLAATCAIILPMSEVDKLIEADDDGK